MNKVMYLSQSINGKKKVAAGYCASKQQYKTTRQNYALNKMFYMELLTIISLAMNLSTQHISCTIC